MPFEKKIIGELHCPRCNAWAQSRIDDERGDVLVVYIVCNKCKLRQYQGLTTRKAVVLKGTETALLKMLDRCTSEYTATRIRARLLNIRRQIRAAEAGIGGRS